MSNIQPQPSSDDLSNGWDLVAPRFIQERQYSSIGVEAVTEWAKSLSPGCDVLDIGCGFGIPVSEALIKQGLNVYGIDASPRLIEEFQRRFPNSISQCETVEVSDFFGKTFDGVIAIGLMFLLSKESQLFLIKNVASALKKGGRFLFTAPSQICTWKDLLTARESISLGRDAYLLALQENNLALMAEFSDDGENHHFAVIKL